MLEKTLSTLSIPDVSGHAGTPVGSVEYSLSKYAHNIMSEYFILLSL